MEELSQVRPVKTAGWIVVVTLAFTALVAFDVVAIGVRGQWTFGVYRDAPAPPHYGAIGVPISGALLMAGALAGAWRRLTCERPRWERAGWLAAVMLGGVVHLVGLILVSRAGMKEPAIAAWADWAGGYFNDALRLRGEPDPIRRWAEMRPRLSLHGRAHPPGPYAMNAAALRFFESHAGATSAVMRATQAMGADVSELGVTKLDSPYQDRPWAQPVPDVEHPWQWAALTSVAWLVVFSAILPAIFIYQIG